MSAFSVENLSGPKAKAVQIACQEFEKKLNVVWENYVVLIEEAETEFLVIFKAKLKNQELRGSPVGIPGFEIRLKKESYEVASFQFSR